MARHIDEDQSAYRIVITYKIDYAGRDWLKGYDGKTFTTCYGPYANKSTAKAQLKRRKMGYWIVLSAEVQECSGWETVDTLVPV